MIVKTLNYSVTLFVALNYSCYICCIKHSIKSFLKQTVMKKSKLAYRLFFGFCFIYLAFQIIMGIITN